MSDAWENRDDVDLARSVLCANRFESLAAAVQPVFRDAMVARIGRRVGHTRLALDLACGLGDWTRAYLDFADAALGIDINARFLSVAERGASEAGVAARCRFSRRSLTDPASVRPAGLIALGGCVQYLEDADVDALFGRIADVQVPGQVLYLRSTVTTALRQPFATPGGRYRTARFYEERLEALGYRLAERLSSATAFCEALTGGDRPERLDVQTLVASTLSAPVWAARQLLRRSDYVNWVWVKR
ncbi:MAG: class I SAM-dependent methyltransferase [Myxococcales bacterium]|nr:class I SAM-dependent methyltransferase [Myxococcales bacterium]